MDDKATRRKARIRKVVELGRKYKFFRYLLIALLAVVIFCDHLIHNTSRRFKVSMCILLCICVLIGALFPGYMTNKNIDSITKKERTTLSVSEELSGDYSENADSGCGLSQDSAVDITLSRKDPILNTSNFLSSEIVDTKEIGNFKENNEIRTIIAPTNKVENEMNLISELFDTQLAKEQSDIFLSPILNKICKTSLYEDSDQEFAVSEDKVTKLDGDKEEEQEESVSDGQLSATVSYNNVENSNILRFGYEEAPEIHLYLENVGDRSLEGFNLESEFFEVVQGLMEDQLEPNEKTTVTLRLKKGMDVGIYEDEVTIKSQNMEKSIGLTVRQEVRRELTDLMITAPDMEIEVGAEVPTISMNDYQIDGLREPDKIEYIKGLVESTYSIENTDTPQVAESEEIGDLSLEDYIITFKQGTLTVVPRKANHTYYMVSGQGRTDDIFCSDITITPTGKDGFHLVRIGEEGQFAESATISEDGIQKDTLLYFSNGKIIAEGTVFTYSKDTVAPIMSVDDKNLQTISENNICIQRDDMGVNINISDASGVERLHYMIQDKEYESQVSDNKAIINIPDNFYGQVDMYCEDLAGNKSDQSSIYVIKENQTPIATYEKVSENALRVQLREMGDIVSGIREYKFFNKGVEIEPTSAKVTEKTLLNGDASVVSGISFILPINQNSETVRVLACDNSGNTLDEICNTRSLEIVSSLDGQQLISVKVPTILDFAIEPKGIMPCGQIYSSDQEFINYSNVPVEIKITDIYYEFTDPENCLSLTKPLEEDSSMDKKSLYLYWSRAELLADPTGKNPFITLYDENSKRTLGKPALEQELVGIPTASENDILLTDRHLDTPISIRLEAAEYSESGELIGPTLQSTAVYHFFGSMNKNPKVEWTDGNVKIFVKYKVQKAKLETTDKTTD
ncbi:MAG: hypothetical protein PHY47_23950 [Lachnospiraceae bacterium]|nr:hypothetical protein [Lachnospiraceae bacterium]